MAEDCAYPIPGSSVSVSSSTCDASSLSPEEFINCVLNVMQTFAQDMANDAINKANGAIAYASGADWTINRPENTYEMTAEEEPVPDVDNVKSVYEDVFNDIYPLLMDLYDQFLDQEGNVIFNPARDAAAVWLYEVIEDGKLGIPATLEDAIWARERDRLIAMGATAKKSVAEQFAAKGWKVASGAVVAGVNDAEISTHREIGNSSTKIAMLQAEETLKSVRFAVEQALKVYQSQLGAAVDWLAAMVRALAESIKVAEVDPNVKANLINATTNLFRARISKDQVHSGSLSQFYNRTVDDVQLKSSNELGKLNLTSQAYENASNVLKGLGMATQSQFSAIVSTAASG